MQRLVASQLRYAVGINHVTQLFLCKGGESLFSAWADRGNFSVLRIAQQWAKKCGGITSFSRAKIYPHCEISDFVFSLLLLKDAGQG